MVKFFINRPIFATVLALIIVVAGLVTLNILPIAQYPEITPPTVQVSAVYPGADAQTVAQTVGLPIEQQVNGVDGMLYMKMMLEAARNDSTVKLPTEILVSIGKDGGNAYTGRLDYLSPNIDLSTGTLNVRANLDNPKHVLKSGLYVTITLPYAEQPNAVLVRDASIGTDQLGKYLYIVNDSNVVRYRPIEVGQLVDDTLRQVTAGISPKDSYVTSALLKVRDGMTIKPIK